MWTCVYDGARRLVLLVAGQGDQHWIAAYHDREVTTPHLRVYRAPHDEARPVLIEVDLDARGCPLAWPLGIPDHLLGSMTLWPGPHARYLWFSRSGPVVLNGPIGLHEPPLNVAGAAAP